MKKSKKKIVILFRINHVYIKRLKKIIRRVVGTITGVYLGLIALLYVPAVQKGASILISEKLKKTLHTEVSIGRIDIGLFNRIIIDDVWIKDQYSQDLLKASRLSAKIEIMPLLQGQIAISNMQFYGFHIQAYQRTPNEKPNYQFLIDAFSGKEKKESDINLKINSILIRRGKLAFDRLYAPQTPGHFNPNHIHLQKISATVSLKALRKDSLNLNVKKLSFEEESGFMLKHLNFKILANDRQAELKHFKLELENSSLTLSPVTATYRLNRQEANWKDKLLNVQIKESIAQGEIHLKDFRYFASGLEKVNTPVRLTAHFSGTPAQISVEELNLYTPDRSLDLNIGATLYNIAQPKRRVYSTIHKFNIRKEGLADLTQTLASYHVNAGDYLTALKDITMSGHMIYMENLLKGQLDLKSAIGNLMFSGSLHHKQILEARLRTSTVQLGQLLPQPNQFGDLKLDVTCQGRLRQGKPDKLTLCGAVKEFSFRKYAYEHINFDLTYQPQGVNGSISINDPNLQLQADGMMGLKTANPYLKLQSQIKGFNPYALSLTDKYADTHFDVSIETDFKGNGLETMEGFIYLNNFQMCSSDEAPYVIDEVRLASRRNKKKRNITLKSDFLNASLEGSFNFNTLVTNSRKLLHHYIPTFINVPKQSKESVDVASLNVDIFNIKPLEKLLQIPMQLNDSSQIEGYFNSADNKIYLATRIPSLSYNGQEFKQLEIIAENQDSAVSCKLNVHRHIGPTPVEFKLRTQAANDHIYTRLDWDNHHSSVYKGTVSAHTYFSLNEEQKLATNIEFNPSQITINDSVWNIHASRILIEPNGST